MIKIEVNNIYIYISNISNISNIYNKKLKI